MLLYNLALFSYQENGTHRSLMPSYYGKKKQNLESTVKPRPLRNTLPWLSGGRKKKAKESFLQDHRYPSPLQD